MKHLFPLLLLVSQAMAQPFVTISKEELKDKIKGGWAGQTIGVTFGAPVEFHYNGTMINDYHPLKWYDGLLKKSMLESPGIYDDLYMDLTFVEVFEKEGLDAPASSHAKAFANAGYMLWHANQAARYNILNGMLPPASGHWQNNPHADCIDYQIEADFAGLMSPGMPNTASAISNKIGHIMNYGDGWYGGVYLGALYTLAFTNKNIDFIVKEGLKTIPANTTYHQCISDVIKWHALYPKDWKRTWFELQKKWTDEIGCPEGVFAPFNIDAKINSAYVIMGLLYGEGDFGKTIEIATRCGQDADCNPSSAGGILGTLLGYKALPAYWKQGLKEAEDIPFKYTSTSLNNVYEIGTRHALQNIERNGGSTNGEQVKIKTQLPKAVQWEQGFTNLMVKDKIWLGKELKDTLSFGFEGTGFVVRGENKMKPNNQSSGVAKATLLELTVDGKTLETIPLPADFTTRRHELTWNYQLPPGKHLVQLKSLKPSMDMVCTVWDVVVYDGTKK